MGEILIRITAILAVACYAGRVFIDVTGRTSESWQRRGRSLWTAGAVAMAVHWACAFHFAHGWSHAAAWEHTRRRTLELIGWDSGVGLIANYVITAMWLIDAIGWNLSLDWPRRHRRWYWTVQVYFAFMMLNATAVFGPWYWTVLLCGLATIMALLLWRRGNERT